MTDASEVLSGARLNDAITAEFAKINKRIDEVARERFKPAPIPPDPPRVTKLEKSPGFEVGDVVELASGGFPMTVSSCYNEENTVDCIWFDEKNNAYQERDFFALTLRKVG